MFIVYISTKINSIIFIITIIGGSSWSLTSAPIGDWHSIASDSTGTYLAAGQVNGNIYTSTSG